MLDSELSAEFRNHSIVEVSSIIGDNPFGDTVTQDEIVLDKPGYNVLGDWGIWGSFDPLGKVINGNKDETVSIWGRMSDLSNHIKAPH